MRTITLIGSSRFNEQYAVCAALLSGLGIVALTHGFHTESDQVSFGSLGSTVGRRPIYDLGMLDKIQQSDAILVVDVSDADEVVAGKGYVGIETARELLWATMNQIPTFFLGDLLSATLKTGGIAMAMTDLVDSLTNGEPIPIDLDSAMNILNHAIGKERVVQAQDETKVNTLHAALSHIAVNIENVQEVATDVLKYLGLDIMSASERNALLAAADPASSLAEPA